MASREYRAAALKVSAHLKFKSLPAGPGCRQDAIVDVSARLINTLYDFIENVTSSGSDANPDVAFLRRANLGELLLLSHSLGAFVACDVLTGKQSRSLSASSSSVCDFANALNVKRMSITLFVCMHAQVVAKQMLVMALARDTRQF